jgi:hypothetical protein
MTQFLENTVSDLHTGRHSWRVLLFVYGGALAAAVAIGRLIAQGM